MVVWLIPILPPCMKPSRAPAIGTVVLSLTFPAFRFCCFSLISFPGTGYVRNAVGAAQLTLRYAYGKGCRLPMLTHCQSRNRDSKRIDKLEVNLEPRYATPTLIMQVDVVAVPESIAACSLEPAERGVRAQQSTNMKHNGTHATSKENDLPFSGVVHGVPRSIMNLQISYFCVYRQRDVVWSRPRGSIISILKHVYTLMKDLSSQRI